MTDQTSVIWSNVTIMLMWIMNSNSISFSMTSIIWLTMIIIKLRSIEFIQEGITCNNTLISLFPSLLCPTLCKSDPMFLTEQSQSSATPDSPCPGRSIAIILHDVGKKRISGTQPNFCDVKPWTNTTVGVSGVFGEPGRSRYDIWIPSTSTDWLVKPGTVK